MNLRVAKVWERLAKRQIPTGSLKAHFILIERTVSRSLALLRKFLTKRSSRIYSALATNMETPEADDANRCNSDCPDTLRKSVAIGTHQQHTHQGGGNRQYRYFAQN